MKAINPYYIDDTAVISFSGGRSSAFMLHSIIEAHGGNLPDCLKVIFCNTGKEMPQTLDFVRDCGVNWGVDITWLELDIVDNKYETKEVNFETASRKGEPFDLLTTKKNYLPNMIARFCTSELKVLRINQYMGDKEFSHVVGIRADEPRRVAKMRGKGNYLTPLADAGVTRKEVSDFWMASDFDLNLPNDNGVCNWGNCDLCFLKGGRTKLSIVRDRPDLADWWIGQEKKIAGRFRSDQPSYQEMKIISTDQQGLFSDESIGCFCGD